MEEVEYRLCPGLVGYRVGNDGSVWCCRKQGPGEHLSDVWRKINPVLDRYGYRVLCVRKNGERKWVKLHHLVLEAFKGPCPEGMIGLHNEDDQEDNRPDHLRWGTHQDNFDDKIKNDCYIKGEEVNTAKLTAPEVVALRADHKSGMNIYELMDRYGIARSTVYSIVTNKTWKHLL
jgi:hypothetical protein